MTPLDLGWQLAARVGPTRFAGGRVDLLIATLFFGPLLWMWAWNGLSKRGDDNLAFIFRVLLIPAGLLFVVVGATAGLKQSLALVGLAGLCGFGAWLHRRSLRRRVAAGEIPAVAPRRPAPSGWRLIGWGLAAFVCLWGAVALLFGRVEIDGVRCGSVVDAIQMHSQNRCAAEGRIHGFFSLVFAAGAVWVIFKLARGRRRGAGGAVTASPGLPSPPSGAVAALRHPRRPRPLRAATRGGAAPTSAPIATTPPPAVGPSSAAGREEAINEGVDDDHTAPPRDEGAKMRGQWAGWLVLVAFLLVLASQVARVTGVLSDEGLGLIFVSIGLSSAAAVLLIVAVWKSKRETGA